ncbi:MAG TPA: Na(+)/H(+) antiporter subunit B [Nitrospiria bacterium]|jgi:multicomponent Na+:H+ antiporter subunit B
MGRGNVIIRFIAAKFIPFIQLFGLYVIMHGEAGPGGGFQGGVILGASMILYGLVFGFEAVRKTYSQKAGDILSSVGVLLYAGIGLLTLLIGGHFLEYRVLPLGTPQFSSHIGILGIEIGVGITVASVMTILFFEMARRKS